jgi:hypothetical protein
MFWRGRYLLSYPGTSHQLGTAIFMAMSLRTSHVPACFFEIHFEIILLCTLSGRDSSVGTATRYGLDGPRIESWWGGEIFRTSPDRPWGPPSLLYNGYRVFPGGRATRARR